MTAVGVVLAPEGATVAVVQLDPPKLVALARVRWADDPAAAQRVLSQVRRRLGLRRWQPVVVVGDGLSGGTADGSGNAMVPAVWAERLARAGLVPSGWVLADAADRARRAASLAIDPRLDEAVSAPRGQLALGAALTALGNARGAPATTAGIGSLTSTDRVFHAPRGARGGWLVESVEPGPGFAAKSIADAQLNRSIHNGGSHGH